MRRQKEALRADSTLFGNLLGAWGPFERDKEGVGAEVGCRCVQCGVRSALVQEGPAGGGAKKNEPQWTTPKSKVAHSPTCHDVMHNRMSVMHT